MGFKQLTVIGLGLIGGSYAKASQANHSNLLIHGIDPNPEIIQKALDMGVIHSGSTEYEPSQHSDVALKQDAEFEELMVLACHLEQSLVWLKTLAPLVQGKSILVTDTGSCKREIVEVGAKLLPQQFIAGHPIAGREVQGFENGLATLFQNKPFLFCPTPAMQDSVGMKQLLRFTADFGALVSTMDADTHDYTMAIVSHLPQLYAVMITNILDRHDAKNLLRFHATGIADQLRLAASPYAMWGDICKHNKDKLRPVFQELRDLIDEMEQALDQPELGTMFERANTVHHLYKEIQAARSSH